VQRIDLPALSHNAVRGARKLSLLVGCALLVSGCASTTIYQPGLVDSRGRGVPLARIDADATGVDLSGPGVTFKAERLDHSAPTRARASLITAGGNAMGKLVMSWLGGSALLEGAKVHTSTKLAEEETARQAAKETTKRAASENATKVSLAEIAAGHAVKK